MKILHIILLMLVFTVGLTAQKGLKTLFEEHIFTDVNAAQKSLSDIIKSHEGKVIYIDFWASWCLPCRKEMPHSIKLHEKLKGQDLVFLYLSIDDKEEAWKKAMNAMSITEKGDHYRRSADEVKELLKYLYIYNIPHYLIVGKNGQLANRDALPPSYSRVEKQLKKLLKQ